MQNWLRTAVVSILLGASVCAAQDTGGFYSHGRAFSGFVEYSNDSSHMLLGYADGRKISAIGAGFEKRSFLTNGLAGSFVAEVRPFMAITDPTWKGFDLQFPTQPAYSGMVSFSSAVPVDKPVSSQPVSVILVSQNQIYTGTATYIGGTRTTYMSAFSPLGYKLSLNPHHRIQPFVTGLGGFAVAPRDVPVFNSSTVNFTFEVGTGVEFYQSGTRSCRFEYRYHHLANVGAAENPGVDSGVFKVSYAFGR
jgi:opacity protein-like surface antigen